MGAAQSLTAVTPELLVISLLLSYCSSDCRDTHPATRLCWANWSRVGSVLPLLWTQCMPCWVHLTAVWFFKICFKAQFQKEVPLGT